jgi:hypothetical protein
MIERLNFYDLYGYLLPGAALIAVVYLPFLMAGSPAPSLELSSAVISLILAYLLGHLLQILVRPVFTEGPYPSDTLITGEGKSGFPADFKSELRKLLLDDFTLDVSKAADRATVFESCRYAVQSKETTSYAEQHQGMYVLMRGLAGVSLIGTANQLGWIIREYGTSHPQVATSILWGSLFALFGHAIAGRAWFWIASAAVLWVGAHGYFVQPGQHIDQALLIMSSVGLVVAATLFQESFRHFQTMFAKAVYVTYFARRRSPLTHNPSKQSG